MMTSKHKQNITTGWWWGLNQIDEWNEFILTPELKAHSDAHVLYMKRRDESKLISKAQDDAKKELIKRACLREYFQNWTETGEVPFEIKHDVKTIMDNQAKKLQTKSPYCLMTVNPRKEIALSELQHVVSKFLKKKTIPEWFLVYEVRSKNEGLHAHILLRYTPTPFDFKRSAINTFKKICDSSNPSILNFKFIEELLLPDKIQYMLGNKQDKKKSGVECTIEYRRANNLEDYYDSSPPLTCRATQRIN